MCAVILLCLLLIAIGDVFGKLFSGSSASKLFGDTDDS